MKKPVVIFSSAFYLGAIALTAFSLNAFSTAQEIRTVPVEKFVQEAPRANEPLRGPFPVESANVNSDVTSNTRAPASVPEKSKPAQTANEASQTDAS